MEKCIQCEGKLVSIDKTIAVGGTPMEYFVCESCGKSHSMHEGILRMNVCEMDWSAYDQLELPDDEI